MTYRRLLGAANPFKEGDEAQGLAAADEASRINTRQLLRNTTVASFDAHPIFEATLASAVPVITRSRDRNDYILHPPSRLQAFDRLLSTSW